MKFDDLFWIKRDAVGGTILVYVCGIFDFLPLFFYFLFFLKNLHLKNHKSYVGFIFNK